MKIKREVPRDDDPLRRHYDWMEWVFSRFPSARVMEDDRGTYRFHPNGATRWLVDAAGENTSADLNAMCLAYHRGAFSRDDYMRFYMDLGYSLCGFMEIFGEEISAALEGSQC